MSTGRLDALQRGKFDPETVRLLLDAEVPPFHPHISRTISSLSAQTNFNQAQAQEVAMLAAGLPKYEPKDDDEFSNEESANPPRSLFSVSSSPSACF